MTHADINFDINGRRVGSAIILGAQPDVAFFDKLKDYLQGECVIPFRVGDQEVTNTVVLNKTELRVSNNFVPVDIESFVQKEKERVRQEQAQANFSDALTNVYFIPAKTLLAWKDVLPPFDRAALVENPEGQQFFVSHRWQSSLHPDPEGKHLTLLKQHARSHPNAFYWIDYCCLPQSRNAKDDTLFRTTLPKIASIQAKCSTIVILQSDYNERLWCYVEHYAGVLFSQTNLESTAGWSRAVEYIGAGQPDQSLLERVQTLEEPPWDKLKVTNPSDIPSIKYNYKFMTNLVKFQLYDRFSELRRSLPGHDIYSGKHYFQSAFGIQYQMALRELRRLFLEFGGDVEHFYTPNSLVWLAERFSWSVSPDEYQMEQFQFSKYLFFSADMVGWIALLLGMIKITNRSNTRIVNLRDLYARIILLSLFK
jgi:hypothetical protein